MKKIELPEYVIADIPKQVKAALDEDIGSGDITAMLIDEGAVVTATVITREDAIMCGQEWVHEIFRQLNGDVKITWHASDGEPVSANQTLLSIKGSARHILTGERPALNFLQTLMGTATTAAKYASAVAGKNITILDTRKTLPGLRTAQKYAVLCGDCENHRVGLYDAFLIKENHIAACGSISKAIQTARRIAEGKRLIVEVESLGELHEAIRAQPDQVMLDNFSDEDVVSAYQIIPKSIAIERSGNFNLDLLRALETQPRSIYISSGAISKHVTAVDLSLRLL